MPQVANYATHATMVCRLIGVEALPAAFAIYVHQGTLQIFKRKRVSHVPTVHSRTKLTLPNASNACHVHQAIVVNAPVPSRAFAPAVCQATLLMFTHVFAGLALTVSTKTAPTSYTASCASLARQATAAIVVALLRDYVPAVFLVITSTRLRNCVCHAQ